MAFSHDFPTPPKALEEMQQWFGTLIQQPLPSAHSLDLASKEKEAARYITSKTPLKAYQRMQIYQEQYWWRLQKALAANFPLLAHLMGNERFEKEMAVPYFTAYPPNHWSLHRLGENLGNWIKTNLKIPEQKQLLEATFIDSALYQTATKQMFTPIPSTLLAKEEAQALTFKPLFLQPHLSFLELFSPLIFLREEILQKKITLSSFSALPKKKSYIVTFRQQNQQVIFKELSFNEWQLLQRFLAGTNLNEIYEWIEHAEDKGGQQAMEEKFPSWFAGWVQAGWLTFLEPA